MYAFPFRQISKCLWHILKEPSQTDHSIFLCIPRGQDIHAKAITKSLTTEGPSGEIQSNAYEPTVAKVKTKDFQHPFPIAVNHFLSPEDMYNQFLT